RERERERERERIKHLRRLRANGFSRARVNRKENKSAGVYCRSTPGKREVLRLFICNRIGHAKTKIIKVFNLLENFCHGTI
ncbi:MAG: hypothetical protein LBD45_03720, partial [Bacteroidales bacterium]|nr:hypothetical protein [Bacteroidales bacterium]